MPASFGDLSNEHSQYESARMVIIPVPYDETSTWIKGAEKGPEAIIEASAHLELYDIETDSQVYREGIFTDSAVEKGPSAKYTIDTIKDRVKVHIKSNKFVVVIGGEHSVSIGAIRAHVESNTNISVLQLDAHADLREEYEGCRHNHACVMARAREMCPVVQVGIRSMDSAEREYMDTKNVFFAKDIFNKKDWIKEVVLRLSDKVYITIDLDVFDPSIMPSTGTPEPGGLLWYDALALLRKVIVSKDVVGFDVVELCPNKNNKSPDFMAAKLIYKLLSYKFRG